MDFLKANIKLMPIKELCRNWSQCTLDMDVDPCATVIAKHFRNIEHVYSQILIGHNVLLI